MIDPLKHSRLGHGAMSLAMPQALPLALACLPLLIGCGDAELGKNEPPFSALLITLDTTRADALTPYGNRPEVTPELQIFSETAVLYERAHTVTPVTLPSHTSMLTGLYPPRHTVRDNGLWALPQSAQTLAETAKERGLSTAAFLSAIVLSESFGLSQGFDLYITPDDASSDGTTHVDERTATEVIDDTIEWLSKRMDGERFFLWVHLFDAHGPHEAPPEFRFGALEKNPYHGEIAYADSQIARLFGWMEERGMMDSTFIAVVADHGEAFGEKNEFSHGGYCNESTMRVPFMLRDPGGYRAGDRSRETVSVVDVYPTLAAAMGLDVSSSIDGKSLFRSEIPEGRGIYLESYVGYLSFGWSPLAGWVVGDRKYLHSSEPELYDLGADPTESRNLFSLRAEEVKGYQREMALMYQREALVPDDESTASERLEDIRGLGYISMGAPTADVPNPLLPSDRPSPASMVLVHRATLVAMGLNNAGRVKEAEEAFVKVLDEHPDNHFARNLLAFCLMRQNRKLEAIPLLQRVISEGPQWPDTYSNLGICLAENGRLEEAEESFRGALNLDPNKPESLFGLSQVLKQTGRKEEGAKLRARWEELTKGS